MKWRASVWRRLLEAFLGIEERLARRLPFSFGGGTALAVHLDHRVSYDIDLFYRSADALDDFDPNKNADVKALVKANAGSWQFPGNYLKLELGPKEGEIDILISKFMTEAPTTDWTFKRWTVPLETPAEIMAKKIRYRASQFKRRDIFDMAAVARIAPDALGRALAAATETLPRLRDRILTMSADYARHVRDDVNPTKSGLAYVEGAPGRCIDAIDGFLLRRSAKRPGSGRRPTPPPPRP